MNKALTIVLLADKSTHENMGRALHALLYAKQAHAAGVDVELIFDGGGVEWAAEFPTNEHFKSHYQELLDAGVVSGVCTFCAGAFKVTDELQAQDATFLDEEQGHPNIGAKIAAGRSVITL